MTKSVMLLDPTTVFCLSLLVIGDNHYFQFTLKGKMCDEN